MLRIFARMFALLLFLLFDGVDTKIKLILYQWLIHLFFYSGNACRLLINIHQANINAELSSNRLSIV